MSVSVSLRVCFHSKADRCMLQEGRKEGVNPPSSTFTFKFTPRQINLYRWILLSIIVIPSIRFLLLSCLSVVEMERRKERHSPLPSKPCSEHVSCVVIPTNHTCTVAKRHPHTCIRKEERERERERVGEAGCQGEGHVDHLSASVCLSGLPGGRSFCIHLFAGERVV